MHGKVQGYVGTCVGCGAVCGRATGYVGTCGGVGGPEGVCGIV